MKPNPSNEKLPSLEMKSDGEAAAMSMHHCEDVMGCAQWTTTTQVSSLRGYLPVPVPPGLLTRDIQKKNHARHHSPQSSPQHTPQELT